MQRRRATLGDLVFGGDVDPFGTVTYIQDITGWDDGAGSTGTVTQRAAEDGGWTDPAHLTPRVIELKLKLAGTSFVNVSRSISRISAGIPLSKLGTLAVNDHGDVLQAQVRQSADPLSSRKGAAASLSISLIAPDPRRFSPAVITASTGLPHTTGGLSLPISFPLSIGATVVSGVLSVTNAGTYRTPPVFTITGPCPAGATITLRETGATLRFAEAIPAGRQLVIDTAHQTAVLDGVAPRTVTGMWFQYPPGVSSVAFAANSYDPDALLSSSHRSAWR